MAKVRVKYFGRVRELFSVKEEEYEVEDSSLEDLLLKHIPSRHERTAREWRKIMFPAEGGTSKIGSSTLGGNYLIFVNGEPRDIKYKLKDGDIVAILPPVGGG
ncbi:MAG: MoaD family protein [Candidatus Bathyarchaeia archaeon]